MTQAEFEECLLHPNACCYSFEAIARVRACNDGSKFSDAVFLRAEGQAVCSDADALGSFVMPDVRVMRKPTV